jgi:hypothetical protein
MDISTDTQQDMIERRRAYYRDYYHKHATQEFLIKERERK